MSNYVSCPSCRKTFEAPEDVSSYDWESGVSVCGRLDVDCQHCGALCELEAKADVWDVEVLDDPETEDE